VSLLLAAGGMECALADEKSPDATHASRLTDLFASAAIDGAHCDGARLVTPALPVLDAIHDFRVVTVTTPEGFAYYALHPCDFADVATRLDLSAPGALVVGIRTIGTTLSAVVAAQLRELGIPADRTTVRPTGHPYDRRCNFEPAQRDDILRAVAGGALFVICDEGPGRSGSSLLSVAEALEREGVPREHILMLCSHEPDAAALCAPNAAQRWSHYGHAAAGMTERLPMRAGEALDAGNWRHHFVPVREAWPAVWPQMERLKFFSRDRRSVFKFEGHGKCGAEVRARNQALADAGFGAPYLGQQVGFGEHELVSGSAVQMHGVTPELLTRMAEYCAWRSRDFSCLDADAADLAAATRINIEREFGRDLGELSLRVERPAICDARMQPHEWLACGERWLKLDAAAHGDDHFYPGPCDIAWDLAGVVVEWQLEPSAQEFLLAAYRRASGDDMTRRLAAYELAYATFRMAWSRMAATAVADAEERHRLLRDYRRYRDQAKVFARRQSAIAA